MKKIIGILILAGIIAIIVLQLRTNKQISENRVYQYDKEKPIKVLTEKVQITDVVVNKDFTGTFDANKDAKINAELPGKITSILVDAGSEVKKGQTLIKLDASLLSLQLEAVNVQIEGFEKDVARYKILTEADAIQGIKLEKTLMGLKAANIQKSTLLEKISKATIKAPFDGVITMKMTEVGSFAAPGMPLLMLTDISELKFKVNVSEKDLILFALNNTYKIKVDAYPDLNLTGVVTSVGSKGNMGNSFPIQLEMANTEDFKIKSKMFGKLLLNEASAKQGIIIPAATIVGSDLEPKVYVIENGKAVLVDISITRRFQNKVVVASGLSAGDEIVTSGFINLFDGANVKN